MPQNTYSLTRLEQFLGGIPGLAPLAARLYQQRINFRGLETAAGNARAYFDGASSSPQTATWKRLTNTPSDWTRSDAQTLRERARWLAGNSPYGRSVVSLIQDNVVGSGIMTQCQVEWYPSRTGDPETDRKNMAANAALNYEIEVAKEEWGMHDADATGERHALYDLQRTVLGAVVTDGGCLVHRRIIPRHASVSGVPLAYAVYGYDRLATEQMSPVEKGNEVVNGFEYRPDGTKAHVWLRADGYSGKTFSLPMSEVRHIYRQDFPGQAEGISWLSTVVASLYAVQDISRNTQISRSLQTAIAALISRDPSKQSNPGLGPKQTVTTSDGKPKVIGTIEPGSIMDVGSGDITAFNPARQDDFDSIIGVICRGVGAGMGLSSELVSGDLRGLSFAGGRIGLGRQYRTTDVIHAFFARKFEAWIHQDFIDLAAAAGVISVPRGRGRYFANFTRPKRDMSVNPYQDIAAAALAIENKMLSRKEWFASLNKDDHDELSQISAEAGTVADIDALQAKNKLAELLSGKILENFKKELDAQLKQELNPTETATNG